MTELSNEALAQLLKQFALGQSDDPLTSADQRAFYEAVRRPLEITLTRALSVRKDLLKPAAQEAWSQVFLSAHRYDAAQGTVVNWVKGIASNCALQVLRRDSRSKRLINEDVFVRNSVDSDTWHNDVPDPLEQMVCPMPGPEQIAQASRIREAVAVCLARLPSKGVPYREAYELALESDLTNQELAELFNAQYPDRKPCNPEQMRKWIARAGGMMRQCLSEVLDPKLDQSE